MQEQNQTKLSILQKIYLTRKEKLKKSNSIGRDFVRSSISATNQRYKQEIEHQTIDKSEVEPKKFVRKGKKSLQNISIKSLRRQHSAKSCSKNSMAEKQQKYRTVQQKKSKSKYQNHRQPRELRTIICILQSNNNGIVFNKNKKKNKQDKGYNSNIYAKFIDHYNNMELDIKNQQPSESKKDLKEYYCDGGRKRKNYSVNKRRSDVLTKMTRESTIVSQMKQYRNLNEAKYSHKSIKVQRKPHKYIVQRKYKCYQSITMKK